MSVASINKSLSLSLSITSREGHFSPRRRRLSLSYKVTSGPRSKRFHVPSVLGGSFSPTRLPWNYSLPLHWYNEDSAQIFLWITLFRVWNSSGSCFGIMQRFKSLSMEVTSKPEVPLFFVWSRVKSNNGSTAGTSRFLAQVVKVSVPGVDFMHWVPALFRSKGHWVRSAHLCFLHVVANWSVCTM